MTSETCTGGTCSYSFVSNGITTLHSVAVDVIGCTSEKIEAHNVSICKRSLRISLFDNASSLHFISKVCDPELLLASSVNWSTMSVTPDGLGVFTFPGGNVTFDGVSLGSTAVYSTNQYHRVNGSQTFESKCGNNNWTVPCEIVPGEEG